MCWHLLTGVFCVAHHAKAPVWIEEYVCGAEGEAVRFIEPAFTKKKHNRGALRGKDCRREQTLKFPYRLTVWLRAPQTERQEAGGAAALSAQYMLLWSRSPGGFKVSCHVLNSQHDTTQHKCTWGLAVLGLSTKHNTGSRGKPPRSG